MCKLEVPAVFLASPIPLKLLGRTDEIVQDALPSGGKYIARAGFVQKPAMGHCPARRSLAEVLFVSRQPLLDAARLLLSVGCKPDAIIARRRVGTDADDMRAPLGVAARYTVDETKTVFAKWKPFCQSAVPAADAPTRASASRAAPPVEMSGEGGRRQVNRVRPDRPDRTDNGRRRS